MFLVSSTCVDCYATTGRYKSSAKSKSSRLSNRPHLIPLFVSFVVIFITSSNNVVKRRGDRVPPCLTPIFVLNSLDNFHYAFVITVAFLFRFIIFCGIPLFFNAIPIISLLTESKAFSKYMN
jgi:hypothetical protein